MSKAEKSRIFEDIIRLQTTINGVRNEMTQNKVGQPRHPPFSRSFSEHNPHSRNHREPWTEPPLMPLPNYPFEPPIFPPPLLDEPFDMTRSFADYGRNSRPPPHGPLFRQHSFQQLYPEPPPPQHPLERHRQGSFDLHQYRQDPRYSEPEFYRREYYHSEPRQYQDPDLSLRELPPKNIHQEGGQNRKKQQVVQNSDRFSDSSKQMKSLPQIKTKKDSLSELESGKSAKISKKHSDSPKTESSQDTIKHNKRKKKKNKDSKKSKSKKYESESSIETEDSESESNSSQNSTTLESVSTSSTVSLTESQIISKYGQSLKRKKKKKRQAKQRQKDKKNYQKVIIITDGKKTVLKDILSSEYQDSGSTKIKAGSQVNLENNPQLTDRQSLQSQLRKVSSIAQTVDTHSSKGYTEEASKNDVVDLNENNLKQFEQEISNKEYQQVTHGLTERQFQVISNFLKNHQDEVNSLANQSRKSNFPDNIKNIDPQNHQQPDENQDILKFISKVLQYYQEVGQQQTIKEDHINELNRNLEQLIMELRNEKQDINMQDIQHLIQNTDLLGTHNSNLSEQQIAEQNDVVLMALNPLFAQQNENKANSNEASPPQKKGERFSQKYTSESPRNSSRKTVSKSRNSQELNTRDSKQNLETQSTNSSSKVQGKKRLDLAIDQGYANKVKSGGKSNSERSRKSDSSSQSSKKYSKMDQDNQSNRLRRNLSGIDELQENGSTTDPRLYSDQMGNVTDRSRKAQRSYRSNDNIGDRSYRSNNSPKSMESFESSLLTPAQILYTSDRLRSDSSPRVQGYKPNQNAKHMLRKQYTDNENNNHQDVKSRDLSNGLDRINSIKSETKSKKARENYNDDLPSSRSEQKVRHIKTNFSDNDSYNYERPKSQSKSYSENTYQGNEQMTRQRSLGVQHTYYQQASPRLTKQNSIGRQDSMDKRPSKSVSDKEAFQQEINKSGKEKMKVSKSQPLTKNALLQNVKADKEKYQKLVLGEGVPIKELASKWQKTLRKDGVNVDSSNFSPQPQVKQISFQQWQNQSSKQMNRSQSGNDLTKENQPHSARRNSQENTPQPQSNQHTSPNKPKFYDPEPESSQTSKSRKVYQQHANKKFFSPQSADQLSYTNKVDVGGQLVRGLTIDMKSKFKNSKVKELKQKPSQQSPIKAAPKDNVIHQSLSSVQQLKSEETFFDTQPEIFDQENSYNDNFNKDNHFNTYDSSLHRIAENERDDSGDFSDQDYNPNYQYRNILDVGRPADYQKQLKSYQDSESENSLSRSGKIQKIQTIEGSPKYQQENSQQDLTVSKTLAPMDSISMAFQGEVQSISRQGSYGHQKPKGRPKIQSSDFEDFENSKALNTFTESTDNEDINLQTDQSIPTNKLEPQKHQEDSMNTRQTQQQQQRVSNTNQAYSDITKQKEEQLKLQLLNFNKVQSPNDKYEQPIIADEFSPQLDIAKSRYILDDPGLQNFSNLKSHNVASPRHSETSTQYSLNSTTNIHKSQKPQQHMSRETSPTQDSLEKQAKREKEKEKEKEKRYLELPQSQYLMTSQDKVDKSAQDFLDYQRPVEKNDKENEKPKFNPHYSFKTDIESVRSSQGKSFKKNKSLGCWFCLRYVS